MSEPRPYFRVTADIEASIIDARTSDSVASYAEIAKAVGVPERTVKYVLVDLPRLRRVNAGEAKAEGSLKRRIMQVVSALGQVADVGELRRVLGMADDEHSVMHVLHSLHTQGKLDFTERGNGMGTATVINIRLPKKGKRNGLHVDEVQPMPVITKAEEAAIINARQHDIEPEATAPQASAPGLDESAAYPLLTELMERERTRQEGDPKALAYVAAAEAIKDVDRVTYDVLMTKAAAFDVPYPSPLEREYLSYVAAHPDTSDDGA
jgi:alkylated DNA nucleotide flippase Atl1